MKNVPKIVRERLKVAPRLVNHPDADVLAAFAEQSLPETEQTSLLEHLSRCADCREVVALAFPAAEPVAVLTPSPSPRLAWPALRWGLAAAGLVVIVSLGVSRYQHASLKPMMAKAKQAAATEARNETLPTVPAPSPANPESSKQRDKFKEQDALSSLAAEAKQPATTLLKNPSPSEPATTGGPLAGAGGGYGHGVPAHGPRMLTQLQQNTNAQQVQAPAAMPAAPAPYARQANAPAGSSRESIQVESQSALAQSAELPRTYDYAEAKVEKTKPAETLVNNVAPRMDAAPAPMAGRAITALASLNPAWRISANGSLQRSLDEGNTWQDIDVRSGSVVSTDLKVAAKMAPARTKKSEPSDSENTVFRAVAANGPEVWAGGTQALLYHSTDGGNHWSRVIPASTTGTLTGDILSLSFPDLLHGTVSTSTPQVWTTSDGGLTWQQQ